MNVPAVEEIKPLGVRLIAPPARLTVPSKFKDVTFTEPPLTLKVVPVSILIVSELRAPVPLTLVTDVPVLVSVRAFTSPPLTLNRDSPSIVIVSALNVAEPLTLVADFAPDLAVKVLL